MPSLRKLRDLGRAMVLSDMNVEPGIARVRCTMEQAYTVRFVVHGIPATSMLLPQHGLLPRTDF